MYMVLTDIYFIYHDIDDVLVTFNVSFFYLNKKTYCYDCNSVFKYYLD